MFTGLAQLVEHWSPKPGVGSSSLSTRAKEISMNKVINYLTDKTIIWIFSFLVGVALAILENIIGGITLSLLSVFVLLWKNGAYGYVKDSYQELKNHVSWPGFNEGLELTVLVGVFSIIFSLVIWALDSVFSRIIKEYFNLLS